MTYLMLWKIAECYIVVLILKQVGLTRRLFVSGCDKGFHFLYLPVEIKHEWWNKVVPSKLSSFSAREFNLRVNFVTPLAHFSLVYWTEIIFGLKRPTWILQRIETLQENFIYLEFLLSEWNKPSELYGTFSLEGTPEKFLVNERRKDNPL